MRSYVVKRFSHFRHSRRRRMESASLLSRESTTLSFANPQKGHFMGLIAELVIVAGGMSAGCWRSSKDGILRVQFRQGSPDAGSLLDNGPPPQGPLWRAGRPGSAWGGTDSREGKTGRQMGRLGRAWTLYQAVAFVVLIPVSIYEVYSMRLPRWILLICIPGYCVLAAGSYQIFKNTKSK